MTKITLSRNFSGFVNVPDTWEIGIDDRKAGTVGDYVLPAGYSVGKTRLGDEGIFGPDNLRCEIITHSSGRPQLISGTGSPVLAQA